MTLTADIAGHQVPIAVSDDGRTATIDPADLADLTESDRLRGTPASAMIDALEAAARSAPFSEADWELAAAIAGHQQASSYADGPRLDLDALAATVAALEADRPAPFNGPLLAAALAKIVADPDHWDQTEWRVTDADRAAAGHPDADPMSDSQRGVCGTSHCLGGWGISLAAEPSQWRQGFSPQGCFSQFLTAVAADPAEHVGRWGTIHVTPGGDWQAGPEVPGVTPFHRAQRLFGLTQQQAMRLFSGGNSLHDLQYYVGRLLATDGAAPA